MRWVLALLLVAGHSVAGDNARHHFRLALRTGANKHYFAVLRVDPRHRAARRALAAGDRTVANDALKLLWRRDPADRALGLLVIDLLAPAERERALKIASRNRRADVRLHAVERLTDPAALARAVLRDRSAAVRTAALKRLPDARHLLPALRSGSRAIRLRAIDALGDLGDKSAIQPLVAHWRVAGGSGQQVYISQTNQITFVQDFDVEVASTAFIADPVVSVIQDGVAFSFRALGHSGERRAIMSALRKLRARKDVGGS